MSALVNVIYADTDKPDLFRSFLEINARLAPIWPSITKPVTALANAEHWKDKSARLGGLDFVC